MSGALRIVTLINRPYLVPLLPLRFPFLLFGLALLLLLFLAVMGNSLTVWNTDSSARTGCSACGCVSAQAAYLLLVPLFLLALPLCFSFLPFRVLFFVGGFSLLVLALFVGFPLLQLFFLESQTNKHTAYNHRWLLVIRPCYAAYLLFVAFGVALLCICFLALLIGLPLLLLLFLRNAMGN